MKFTCPKCQSKYSLEEASRHEAMCEIVDLAARFGRDWNLVREYVNCFRREQWGTMTLQKKVRLLKEVYRLYRHGEFEFDRRRYRAGRDVIITAMTEITNREKIRFTNHNYLKQTMINNGAERLSAEGLTAKEESDRERSRMEDSGRRDEAEDMLTTDEVRRRAGQLVDQIGKIK